MNYLQVQRFQRCGKNLGLLPIQVISDYLCLTTYLQLSANFFTRLINPFQKKLSI